MEGALTLRKALPATVHLKTARNPGDGKHPTPSRHLGIMPTCRLEGLQLLTELHGYGKRFLSSLEKILEG